MFARLYISTLGERIVTSREGGKSDGTHRV